MPRFSIIVPIYNVEPYLEECLTSIKNQTFTDFEVLCVIDGATDNSLIIAKGFAATDRRFLVLTQENKGVSSARNLGIEKASGDIITFVDGDDYVSSNYCQTIAEAMGQTDTDILIFGGEVVPLEYTTPWYEKTLSPPIKQWNGFCTEFMFSPFTTPFIWTLAIKRTALIESGVRFNESLILGEDAAFQFALYPRLKEFASTPDKLYFYRVNREGSQMERHQVIERKLAAHLTLVESIFSDWESLGLLEKHSRDLFNWSLPYLLDNTEKLSPEKRNIHLKRVNSLWDKYFERLIHFDLNTKCLCLCRGDGKLYILYEVSSFAPFYQLTCVASANGLEIPANAYPLYAQNIFCEKSKWVVELPLIDAAKINFSLIPDERFFERANIEIDTKKAKWISRLNYRIKPNLCASIRDIDQTFLNRQYQSSIYQRFNGDNCILWRCKVQWIGKADTKPILLGYDQSGSPLKLTQYFCEFQEGDEEKLLPHVLYLSVQTPPECNSFTLRACCSLSPDSPNYIKDGFACIGVEESEYMKVATKDLMKSAGDDRQGYIKWLYEHKAKSGNLKAKKALEQRWLVDSSLKPLFSIFIISQNKENATNLRQTINSVIDQSFQNWNLCILTEDDTLQLEYLKDERVSLYFSPESEIINSLTQLTRKATGEYIACLRSGDILEPNALFEFAYTLNNLDPENTRPAILYCDEDAIDSDGSCINPVFKSQLNIDLLYCYNWIGQFAAIRQDIFKQIVSPSKKDASTWIYDVILQTYEHDTTFKYIPKLLFHSITSAAPYSAQNPTSTTFIDNTKEHQSILQRHLTRRGIAAKVEEGLKPNTVNVSYDLPSPHPLVSILIPSMDHVDLIRTCVKSILSKSTYNAYEILIIENNSTQAETFAFYDEIQREYDQVKVIFWEHEFNFSKIINFGASQASGDYYLLMNNDTEVIEPTFIEKLLGCLQRPEVGIAGAKLLFRDNLVQHAGIGVGVWDAVVNYNQFFTNSNGGYLDRAIFNGNFSAVTAACHMLHADLFHELNGYDEAFAVAFNDIDFCLRVLEKGKVNTLVPSALLYHYEFSSRGREEVDDAKLERWRREQGLFMKKWPAYFVHGDPYTSPNLMRNNTYFRLN